MSISIWGGNLFAGDPTLVVSVSGEQRLDVFTIADEGKLKLQTQETLTAKPGTSCYDLTGRHLYVGCSDPECILVLRVEENELTQLQRVLVPAKPSFFAIAPSGDFLISCYYSTGQVTVHRIVGEGRLSDDPVQTLQLDERAHGITIDPSGWFVFVAHTRPNCITQLRMDVRTGQLTPNEPAKLVRAGIVGPRHLWFHPTENFVYGSNEQGKSVSVYRLDSQSGTLSELQTLSSVPDDFEGPGSTSHIEGHPSGKYVYVANRGHGSIAAFSVDSGSGKLTLMHRAPTGATARSFSLSPDGRFLVASGQRSGRLHCYRIDDEGKLTATDSVDAGRSPWWVSFSPVEGVGNDFVAEAQAQTPRRRLTLGQGTMAGEVSDSSVLLQTRLTAGTTLDSKGDLPGSPGVAAFEWSLRNDFADAVRTPLQVASPDRDFIVRASVTGLTPDTKYNYRALFGETNDQLKSGPTCSFRTLPGEQGARPVKFIIGSCMNYIKFMHGRAGKASGPLTATDEDKRLGFPSFVSMKEMEPEFFVGTGDIVYYDNPFRVAETVEELRRCWHEQFRFPRMIEFFRDVPAYWSKDDHDFRFNDSDPQSKKEPSAATGIELFQEQLPIVSVDDPSPRTYRTIRVSRDLQIWLTEGRDYRSANRSPDGPEKTMWGREQREWLKSTLAGSDAKWKLLISPTPMVGPDDGYKSDNHANLKGFRHEADAFFQWVKDAQLENLFLICGDRHWQYHSIHPSGINEFSCGALNDENSRMGVAPGAKFGSDPHGLVRQPFTSAEPSGGFLQVIAGDTLGVTFFDDRAKELYRVSFP
ncbi:beta-propeller fold lactonase family protein [Aporhodopirellula aestuarii]|uniref:Beta-propeller fold lactonase family protein n=1 Tax=Aporhodopirellula aestuarii TaxID=2950107 RepID=A0ABT0TYQ4_9BACT|nr:beta-propeller fold lactonase family protein [Aporhodopirellula aestuarii]MCM2369724.1 beta-propeller fold lactonase family protein [Aporhodopirellula aestuarii]